MFALHSEALLNCSQEVENHRMSENCDKLTMALKQHEAELKRKDEEIHELQSKVHMYSVRLAHLRKM
jgi:hypothetical protein